MIYHFLLSVFNIVLIRFQTFPITIIQDLTLITKNYILIATCYQLIANCYPPTSLLQLHLINQFVTSVIELKQKISICRFHPHGTIVGVIAHLAALQDIHKII